MNKLFSFLFIICFINCVFGIETPDYEVLRKIGDNIEIRRYSPTKWVGVTVNGGVKDLRSNYQTKMFWSLFNYISGKNNMQMKMEMTAPVLMEFENCNTANVNMNSQCDMSMKFYVPKINQANTPSPTGANNMFVKNETEIIIAAIRFGGYPTMNDNLNRRDSLIAALGSEASKFDLVNFKTAGYNSPWQIFFRRNEIWLRKN